jgi:Protein of unknown function (DUF3618)
MSTPSNQQTDPEQLRREIAEIRRQLGETVAQLAQKADGKAQAREKVQDVRATGARRHPVPLATVGALALGFVLGRLAARRD